MSVRSTSKFALRIVRALLLLLGVSAVAYAFSGHPLYGGETGFGRFQMLIVGIGFGLALCGILPASIAERILLLTLSSLVMLAFGEIAGEILLGPRHRPIYQADDRLIFKFIPNRRSTITRSTLNGGETVTHRINSDGFRGAELLPTGAAVRVVVYGDSFIHAFYTREEETFAARLGGLLAGRLGREVEMVNAGVSSYGPDQISLKMKDELPRLRPDLVIVAVFAGNDYGDLMRNKMFRLGADGILVENRWVLDPMLRRRFTFSQQESILKRALRSVFAPRPAAADRTGAGKSRQNPGVNDLNFLRDEAEREYRNFIVERDNVVTNTHMDYYSADISLMPSGESARYKIALMAAVLRRIRDIAAHSHVPLAFLFIPHPFDVTDDYDGWRADRARFPEYSGRNQIAPLEEMARTLAVPFVSLYDVYRANDANSLYFHGGDDHWNAAGQRMAAQEMANYLLAHDLPRAGGAPAATPERSGMKR